MRSGCGHASALKRPPGLRNICARVYICEYTHRQRGSKFSYGRKEFIAFLGGDNFVGVSGCCAGVCVCVCVCVCACNLMEENQYKIVTVK